MWFELVDDNQCICVDIIFCKNCIWGHFDDHGDMIEWDLHCPMRGNYELTPYDNCSAGHERGNEYE